MEKTTLFEDHRIYLPPTRKKSLKWFFLSAETFTFSVTNGGEIFAPYPIFLPFPPSPLVSQRSSIDKSSHLTPREVPSALPSEEDITSNRNIGHTSHSIDYLHIALRWIVGQRRLHFLTHVHKIKIERTPFIYIISVRLIFQYDLETTVGQRCLHFLIASL